MGEYNTQANPLYITTPDEGVDEIAGAAVDQYAILKLNSSNRFVMMAAGDAGNLMVGVALTAAAGNGSAIKVLQIYGITSYMLSDGTGTITTGELVSPSATVAGRVMQDDADPVGTARTTVAATLHAQLQVL